ncbi:Crp/Fnr family transcriptional regulator [uncultured Cetobacterium sp.]|uniref:Crp/Fnr family transcriptional regulator n=1 Tax=uncultured Cetobacterium sp. TaxID=527638 RepID=UPI0026355F41|nr:Crp/Fnr family transcriptional regulator [uncultured Cetobacterium sp.]
MELKNIKNVRIFEGVSLKEIKNIFENINYSFVEIEKNEILFFRGDELNTFNIILNGELSGEMLKENGEIKKIENLKTGDIIASAFIFGDSNILPVDLRALKNTRLISIDKDEFLKIFVLNKKILKNFLDEISSKTQFLSKKIWKSFTIKTIKEKLDDYIEENMKNNEIHFEKNVKELAEIFSVSRPSLSRVLSVYLSEGKLEKIGKNSYKIKNK